MKLVLKDRQHKTHWTAPFVPWNGPHVPLKTSWHLSNCMFYSPLSHSITNTCCCWSWAQLYLVKSREQRQHAKMGWGRRDVAQSCKDPLSGREVALTASATFSVKSNLEPQGSIPICMLHAWVLWEVSSHCRTSAAFAQMASQLAQHIRLLNLRHSHDFTAIFTQNLTKSGNINGWARFAEVRQKPFNQFELLCVLTTSHF